MKRTVIYNGQTIEYELIRKNVKNINLGVRGDGSVYVSASGSVKAEVTDTFVLSKANILLKYKHKKVEPLINYFSEDEVRVVIESICHEVYPYFEKRGVKMPKIKFRKMVSRWGSCNVREKVITFNLYLMYAPKECVRYVVLHEFCHFFEANHSKRFYNELEKVCPDWKSCRMKLKKINLEQVGEE